MSDTDVRKSLAQLKKVKETLQKINVDIPSSGSSNSVRSSDLIRNSIEMLKNGGKFTKSINDRFERKLSHTSIKNSMTVSPCNFSPRTTKISRKPSFTKLSKKIHSKHYKAPASSMPNIVKTFYATCRIHRYSDDSHSFEIMQIRSDNSGDSHATIPEVVIVALASGQTALFKSNKQNNSFLDDFPSGDDTDRDKNS